MWDCRKPPQVSPSVELGGYSVASGNGGLDSGFESHPETASARQVESSAGLSIPAQAAKPLERVIPQEKAESDDTAMPTPPARSNTPFPFTESGWSTEHGGFYKKVDGVLVDPAPAADPKPKRDRNPYMRQYMVNWRAKRKANAANKVVNANG